QGDDIVPIPGTTRVVNLEDNIGALGVTLTTRDLERIDAVFPKGVAAGDRYMAGGMAIVNREDGGPGGRGAGGPGGRAAGSPVCRESGSSTVAQLPHDSAPLATLPLAQQVIREHYARIDLEVPHARP